MNENDLRIFQGQAVEVAYHLEGHPIAIAELQRLGKLTLRKVRFREIEVRQEVGLEWFTLYYTALDSNLRSHVVLFSGECNLGLMNDLRRRRVLTIIGCPGEARPDVCFGRKAFLVAAVLSSKGEALYQSPGFDLGEWRESARRKSKL